MKEGEPSFAPKIVKIAHQKYTLLFILIQIKHVLRQKIYI
jgi:hypothetical protein